MFYSDHEKNAVINREQQYNEYYRVWEVSQLDCLIREQKDLQKSISVEGVNQYVAQGYSFAKLWKLVIVAINIQFLPSYSQYFLKY